MTPTGPEIEKSALIIVDMQNDFVHPEGQFGIMAKQNPERDIDFNFLSSPIPRIKRLASAFRNADRPVIYVAHVLKSDYSDAAFPYWRRERSNNPQFIVEGTWGAKIIDELKPEESEHLVVKKGYGGFSNTSLDTILRTLSVTTCVVTGVTTCTCVSTTIRGGVEKNYRMIIVGDGTADTQREAHEHELKTMARVFGDVKTTDEVIDLLARRAPCK
jgi:ureidoacrylate peracid hydrolase